MRIYKNHRNAHSIGWSEWHLQFCTKYRYKIFCNAKYKNICKILINESCKRHNLKLLDCEVDIDHVHVLVSIPLTMTPTKAVNCIKGYISYCLFRLCPDLKQIYPRGHLWSHGKFVGSIGHITLDKAKKYVELHYKK